MGQDPQKVGAPLPYPKGFILLPRRCIVERTFWWSVQDRGTSKGHGSLCPIRQASILVPTGRLVVGRSARSWGFFGRFLKLVRLL